MVQAIKVAMRKEREAQAQMFKGAFGSPGERKAVGLWGEPDQDAAAASQMNGAHKASIIGWLWAVITGWLALLFGLRSWRR